jgi:hypothetical protein
LLKFRHSIFIAEPIRWLLGDSGFMMNRQMISAHKIDIVIMMVLLSREGYCFTRRTIFPRRVTGLTDLVRAARFQERQMPSTMGSLLSAHIWSRVAACPLGELRECAAELAFQASDVGTVADALEPLQHQRHFLAVLPDRFDWRLRERDRPTQHLR